MAGVTGDELSEKVPITLSPGLTNILRIKLDVQSRYHSLESGPP